MLHLNTCSLSQISDGAPKVYAAPMHIKVDGIPIIGIRWTTGEAVPSLVSILISVEMES